jgi:hypothetical protein
VSNYQHSMDKHPRWQAGTIRQRTKKPSNSARLDPNPKNHPECKRKRQKTTRTRCDSHLETQDQRDTESRPANRRDPADCGTHPSKTKRWEHCSLTLELDSTSLALAFRRCVDAPRPPCYVQSFAYRRQNANETWQLLDEGLVSGDFIRMRKGIVGEQENIIVQFWQ